MFSIPMSVALQPTARSDMSRLAYIIHVDIFNAARFISMINFSCQ